MFDHTIYEMITNSVELKVLRTDCANLKSDEKTRHIQKLAINKKSAFFVQFL